MLTMHVEPTDPNKPHERLLAMTFDFSDLLERQARMNFVAPVPTSLTPGELDHFLGGLMARTLLNATKVADSPDGPGLSAAEKGRVLEAGGDWIAAFDLKPVIATIARL